MAYTPVVLTKNGKTRTASTLEEEIDLRWDGWLPTGSAAPYPRPLKELVGAETEAALGAAYAAWPRTVRGLTGPLRLGPVAGRTIWPGTGGMSNGTDTYGNYRGVALVARSATDLRLVYVNSTKSETASNLTGLTDVTVRAALEIGGVNGGTIIPVFFSGRRSVTIEPGGYAISDPIGVHVTAGTALYFRTNVSVASGGKWPLGETMPSSGFYAADGTTLIASGGGGATGTGANVDLSTSGSITGSVFHFAPVAILGTPDDPTNFGPVVGLVADSKGTGTGDNDNPPPAGRGYFRRAVGSSFSALDVAVGGSKTSDWLVNGTQNAIKNAFLSCCQHVVVDLGTNDFNGGRTWAQTQPDMISVWQWLSGVKGAKVYATTVIPSTTSTDSWATLANQTVKSGESYRLSCNAWLRDGAPMLNGAAAATGSSATGTVRAGDAGHPVAAVFDFAAATESSLNSGLFRVDLGTPTTDGVHPSTALHKQMAAQINTALFT